MRQRLESWGLLTLALLQPISGRLAQIFHCGASIEQRSDATRGPITPANGAFAIWGPLFGGSLALAVRSFHRRRVEAPVNGWIAWLSGVAFAGNCAWSLEAQFKGLGWPSFGIISASTAAAAAATIVAGHAGEKSGFAQWAAWTLGPLAGWLTIATCANLDAILVETQGRPAPHAHEKRTLALIGAASAAATGMAVATRGNLGYAEAAAWGMGGILLRNRKEGRQDVAIAAAAGIGAVAIVTLLSRRCLR